MTQPSISLQELRGLSHGARQDARRFLSSDGDLWRPPERLSHALGRFRAIACEWPTICIHRTNDKKRRAGWPVAAHGEG
jgi:hypothetical protein